MWALMTLPRVMPVESEGMAMAVKDEPLSADEARELEGLKTLLLQERVDGES
jgi:hypothetical protein